MKQTSVFDKCYCSDLKYEILFRNTWVGGWPCLKINIEKFPSFTVFTPVSLLNIVNINWLCCLIL